MKKVVVQASGGIESTTMIAQAISIYGKENVFPIAFDNDSICWKMKDRVAIKEVLVSLQMYHRLFICRMPQADELEYRRDEEYEDSGFIPGFKMMFNTASMAYAQKIGATEVWIGHMQDNVYDDETPQFLADLQLLYNRTYCGPRSEDHVSLVTPYLEFTKGAVIKLGYSLMGDTIFDTVSCGDERIVGGLNCGCCPWCKKRRLGFIEAGIPDLSRYLFRIEWVAA